ncbi:hypothetical protein QUF80_23070 [Desulfococcaceae bacterium HSG8]|nr:hypothetical protein [Desulfococcaceae bacterium HSG8]
MNCVSAPPETVSVRIPKDTPGSLERKCSDRKLSGKHPFFNFPFGRLKGSELVELHASLSQLSHHWQKSRNSLCG